MAYLTHDAVGIDQPTIGGVERLSDDGVLEDIVITFRQLLSLSLLAQRFGFVDKSGNDVNGFPILVFSYGATMHIVPVGFALPRIIIVPTVTTLRFFIGAIAKALDPGAETLTIIRMNIFITNLYTNIIAEDSLPIQIVQTVLLQVKTHDMIAADVERHNHGLLLIKLDIIIHRIILLANNISFLFYH